MTLLDAALACAARGWAVFPLRGKVPYIPKAIGGRGVHDATIDKDQITEWFTKWPDANVGLACGEPSGLWALDVDPRHGGDDSLAALEAEHGALPCTVEQFTGGGGRHILFKFNGETIRNRANDIGPGLDTRSTGGYIVIEPSRHPETTQAYAWCVDHHPDETKLARAPEWLLARASKSCSGSANSARADSLDPFLAYGSQISDPAAYAQAALEKECEAVAAAPIGEQEQRLNAAALKIGSLIGAGLDHDAARQALIEAGLRMTNDPGRQPWTADKITEKVDHGLRDGMAQPRAVVTPTPTQAPHTLTRTAPAADLPDLSQACTSRWIGVEPEPLRFTIDELVPEGMVTLLVAQGGAGKSLLMQTAALCIPTGLAFLGQPTAPGSSAFVAAEDPDVVLHHRHIRLCDALDVDPDSLIDRCFIQSYAGMNAVLWHRGAPTPFMAALESQLAEIEELRYLALDNVALLFAGDEVSRIEVTAFLNCLTGIAERCKIGLVLSTHVSKSADGSTLRTASGSTAWINACRSVLHLEALPDDPDKAKLTLIKANHAKPGKTIPLLWQDAVLVREPEPGDLEKRLRTRRLDRTIFERVEQRWKINNPLATTYQSGDRYLPKALARDTEFSPRELRNAMNLHLDAGNLIIDQQGARGSPGLKVAKWPDNLKPEGE